MAPEGRLADNIVHFVRALRKAGVRVGPAQAAGAVQAVHVAGFSHKADFYHTLRATLITRAEHLEVFHQVFQMFWRDPEYLARMIRMMSPLLQAAAGEEAPPQAAARRASDALGDDTRPSDDAPARDELTLDARFNWSANEVLRAKDFEQMSASEQAEAARALGELTLPVKPLTTRRLTPSPRGSRPDTRKTLRAMLRKGGEIDEIRRRAPRTRAPDLVAICDISGSMSAYSRMILHFLHALALASGHNPRASWGRVHGFTFGTRLSNISRALHLKDVDQALRAAGHDAEDWQGGTRIGASLADFNRVWSRRVLARGATVLLITDGLERADTGQLSAEIARLSRSCRHLIWLNPLLRWDGFEPSAAGIKTILPHVDSFHACHSLDSLAELAAALSAENLQVSRAAFKFG